MPTSLPPTVRPKVSPKKNTMIDRRLGGIEVTAVAGYDHRTKQTWYECRCDCGAVLFYSHSTLNNNSTTDHRCNRCRDRYCGPRHHHWKGHGEISAQYWAGVRIRAEKRGITFNLSIEEAWTQFMQQNGKCALTGLPLLFPQVVKDRGTASLDRISSDGIYEAGNVQWVHVTINKMKGSLPQKEFVAFCKAVSSHHRRKPGKANARANCET